MMIRDEEFLFMWDLNFRVRKFWTLTSTPVLKNLDSGDSDFGPKIRHLILAV